MAQNLGKITLMKSQYALPITIVIAGILVAGAIFLVAQKPGGPSTGPVASDTTPVPPLRGGDHLLGNPKAPVVVIEYMDLECQHCKVFESTMQQIMSYYGLSGNVAWVSRPMPLTQIHPKAPQEAQAAECAAELGGNDAYWKFVDAIFAVTPSNNGLDLNQLPTIAKSTGLDEAQFNTCLASNKYAKKVQDSYSEAVAAGAQGTPHIVIVGSGGASLTLEGAQPYSSMRSAIDQMLEAAGVSATPSGTSTQ